MTQKQATNIEIQIQTLSQEVFSLRSLFLSFLLDDKDGEHKPSFVRRVKKSFLQPPAHEFKSPESFLAELKRV